MGETVITFSDWTSIEIRLYHKNSPFEEAELQIVSSENFQEEFEIVQETKESDDQIVISGFSNSGIWMEVEFQTAKCLIAFA